MSLTINDVARALSVDYSTILREIKRGRLNAAKVGTMWRIEQASVDAYLEAAKATPAPAIEAREEGKVVLTRSQAFDVLATIAGVWEGAIANQYAEGWSDAKVAEAMPSAWRVNPGHVARIRADRYPGSGPRHKAPKPVELPLEPAMAATDRDTINGIVRAIQRIEEKLDLLLARLGDPALIHINGQPIAVKH